MLTLITIFLITLSAERPAIPDTLPPHAIYLAVVQVDHSDLDGKVRVLVKVFTDDLQDAVRAAYPERYHRTDVDAFCRANATVIEAYFGSTLHCEINGRRQQLVLESGSVENDVYWLTFSMAAPKDWREIRLEASFFMEIFSTQSNVLQILHGAEKRFARLTKTSSAVTFGFDD